MKKKIGIAAILILCTLLASGCKAPDEKPTVDETSPELDMLVMATHAEFPPYEYYDGKEIVGIDVDIAQAIADKMGKKLKVENMAFGKIPQAVANNKADIGVSGLTITKERQEAVTFTAPYASSSQVIIVKEDSEIASHADLQKKVLGVQKDTTGAALAGTMEKKRAKKYKKISEAVQALAKGKVDAVIVDEETAKAFVKSTEGLKILNEKLTEESYAIALKKGDLKFQSELNIIIEELREEGTLDAITAKYITTDR